MYFSDTTMNYSGNDMTGGIMFFCNTILEDYECDAFSKLGCCEWNDRCEPSKEHWMNDKAASEEGDMTYFDNTKCKVDLEAEDDLCKRFDEDECSLYSPCCVIKLDDEEWPYCA
jgi:hypothetical protein